MRAERLFQKSIVIWLCIAALFVGSMFPTSVTRKEGKPKIKVEYPASSICERFQKHTAIVTAYTAGRESTNKERDHSAYGITASGAKARVWRTIAMDKRVPFGTVVYIPYFRNKPNGGVFVVEDRGGAIKLNREPVGIHKIDVFFPNYVRAIQFGRKTLEVFIFSGGIPCWPQLFHTTLLCCREIQSMIARCNRQSTLFAQAHTTALQGVALRQ